MDEEFKFQLCAKITQLTRVIFLINAKNDEFQAIIDSLIAAYENERTGLITKSKIEIDKLKLQIKNNYSQTQSKFTQELSKIKNQYENNLSTVKKQIETIKRDSQSKLQILQNYYQKKSNDIINQLKIIR